ncbi:MAG: hypothetical protein V2A67_07050 [Bacteroidota bacterium]
MKNTFSIFFIMLSINSQLFTSCEKEIVYENGITDLTGAYFGQQPPGTKPEQFGPAIIKGNQRRNWHGKTGFSPDGNRFFMEFYFMDSANPIQVLEMVQEEGYWTVPARPGFANGYLHASPAFMDNGTSILFITNRPDAGSWGLMTSDLTGAGWSAPKPFIVSGSSGLGGGFEVSVARNGNVYTRLEELNAGNATDIFLLCKENGRYLPPENLGPNINSIAAEDGPFIDPDEEYLLFVRRVPANGNGDIYISFRKADGAWEPAQKMDSGINTSHEESCPYVSPDKKYLFFTRYKSGIRNPWWINSSVIEELKSKDL